MGTLVCQSCDVTITHFYAEKVTILYGNCPECARKNRKRPSMTA